MTDDNDLTGAIPTIFLDRIHGLVPVVYLATMIWQKGSTTSKGMVFGGATPTVNSMNENEFPPGLTSLYI